MTSLARVLDALRIPGPRAARRGALALAVNALLAALVYGAYLETPLRLYDHHLVMLLADHPELHQEHFFWRLVHHRLGGETQMYFRYLSYPLLYLQSMLCGTNAAAHYAVHAAAHLGAAFMLYRIAGTLSRSPLMAFLAMTLFMFFCGSSDLMGTPYYAHVSLAVAVAGAAILRFLRHLATGRPRDLVTAGGLMLLATVIYDTFLLLALALPFLAAALRHGSLKALFFPGRNGWLLFFGTISVLLLMTLTQSLVPAHMRSSGIGQSALDTLAITLLRFPVAAATSVTKFAADALFFMTGHLAVAVTPGHMPYWEIGSLLDGTARATLSFASGIAGWRLLARSGAAPRAAGVLLWGLCIRIDPLASLAAFFATALGTGAWTRASPSLLFLMAGGFLCAFNTAVGRSRLYSLAAIRHHYVSGFFLVLAIAHVTGLARTPDIPLRARRGLAALLVVLVLLNIRATSSFIAGYKRDIRGLLDVHRTLDETAALSERLFIPFSTSALIPPRIRPNPAEDWVFDILRGPDSPLTRHVVRARFLLENGKAVPNPLHGSPVSSDFLVRFRLQTEECPLRFDVKESYHILGRKEEEPLLAVTRSGFRLTVTRTEDGSAHSYDFPLPVETNRFFYETKHATLERKGNEITLVAQDYLAGRYHVGNGEEFVPWRTDNTGLIGRDFESLLAKLSLYDTYIRIGPGLPGRIP